MAYTGRRIKGRKGKKKSGGATKWMNRGAKVGYYAYKGYGLAKRLARFVNTEEKYLITNIAAACSSSGTVYQLCYTAQGDGASNRDGLSIKPSRISGRVQVVYDVAAASVATVRLIMFRYKQENGVAPTTSSILDTTGSAIWLNGKNYIDRFQSKVLWDKLIPLSENGTMNRTFDINIKLFGHIEYSASAATAADLNDGGLYLLAVCDLGATQPQIFAQLRLTYVDN